MFRILRRAVVVLLQSQKGAVAVLGEGPDQGVGGLRTLGLAPQRSEMRVDEAPRRLDLEHGAGVRVRPALPLAVPADRAADAPAGLELRPEHELARGGAIGED